MLNVSDIYTSLGADKVYSCWNQNVTKFDASSFYNWEEDNLPVLDLDERTSFLWNRLGSPTSSITGYKFLVSSTAASSCDNNVFTSLSACLDRLPDVINFPVVIEVGSIGHLGELNLSNKIGGPRGSIEIINRGFSKGESFTTSVSSIVLHAENSRNGNPYGLASSISVGNTSLAVAFQFGPADIPNLGSTFHLTRTLDQIRVTSANYPTTLDSRWVGNTTVISKKGMQGNLLGRTNYAVADRNPTAPMTWGASDASDLQMNFTVFEANAPTQDSINTFDASCINELTGSEIQWGSTNNTGNSIVSPIAYMNMLSKVKVYNCDIPIYIRNFTLDGSGYNGTEYGFDIKNSNVVLENCSVARCTKAGLRAQNSNVILTRGFVAYRNYGYDTSGNRLGTPWLQKIKQKEYKEFEAGAGILLENSQLTFSSTYERDYLSLSSALDTNYAGAQAFFNILLGGPLGRIVPSMGWLFSLARNDIGLKAVNSIVRGGRTELNGQANIASYPLYYDAMQIFSELNTEDGIKLENSVLENSGRLVLVGNFRGMNAVNSIIKTDVFKAQYNQKEGCLLKNSTFKYNKDLYQNYLYTSQSIADGQQIHQNSYFLNGTHLKLLNSVYEPTQTSSIPTIFERFVCSGNFGATQDLTGQKVPLPPISVEQGSKLVMVHPAITNSDALTDSEKSLHGAAVSVTDNSELVLKGSKAFMSKIYGPSTYALQSKKAGLYASNHSTIKVQGPTVIARYAIDALADNNSKIEFSPHRTREGELDVSSYNLTDKGNHTSVELHSTRACLVVDNGSLLSFEDLGDYKTFWNRGSYGSSMVLSGFDYPTESGSLDYALYTSAGSVQFYPNPNDSTHYGPGIASPTSLGNIYTSYNMSVNGYGYNYLLEDDIGNSANNQNFSSVTVGGMCVRALNGSKINVDNTHFPCGWWNPSGIIYDVSGADAPNNCNRLFIWNIADLSQLDAKLVSVSGLHPADAAYFGPSGVWGSASSAPVATLDTSTVSILDFYGRSTNHIYSRSTAANQGPFRLYFSVDPAINWANNIAGTAAGFIPQVYSQGYQFSANLVFPGTVSSLYTSIVNKNGSNLEASGFYYASDIVDSPTTVRAVLDDSAANTFANAKHNSVGKSYLAKIVSIYLPITGSYGGDSANSSVKALGRGVKSVNTFDLEKSN